MHKQSREKANKQLSGAVITRGLLTRADATIELVAKLKQVEAMMEELWANEKPTPAPFVNDVLDYDDVQIDALNALQDRRRDLHNELLQLQGLPLLNWDPDKGELGKPLPDQVEDVTEDAAS